MLVHTEIADGAHELRTRYQFRTNHLVTLLSTFLRQALYVEPIHNSVNTHRQVLKAFIMTLASYVSVTALVLAQVLACCNVATSGIRSCLITYELLVPTCYKPHTLIKSTLTQYRPNS